MGLLAVLKTAAGVTALLLAVASPAVEGVANPSVYEINTRVWLYDLFWQNGQKTVTVDPANDPAGYAFIQKSLSEIIKKNKPDHIWMMGIWKVGKVGPEIDKNNLRRFQEEAGDSSISRDDVIGSPYSVFDYSVNPLIGTDSGMLELKKWLNQQNVKLMTDFVPNHVAIDHPWACSNPDYLMQVTTNPRDLTGLTTQQPRDTLYIKTCNRDVYYGGDFYNEGWKDVVQLNYWNPELRKAQIENLVKIARVSDSIRVDMAMTVTNVHIRNTWLKNPFIQNANSGARGLIPAQYQSEPAEFWPEALAAARAANPEIIIIAEGYNYGFTAPYAEDQLLHLMGFDYVYNIVPLKFIANNDIAKLRGNILGQSDQFWAGTVNFVENHDEKRAASALGGKAQAQAGAVLVNSLPGMRLFYFGQEFCKFNKVPVQLRKTRYEGSDQGCANFFSSYLTFLGTDPVIRDGAFSVVTPYITDERGQFNANLFAFKYVLGNSARFVVVNYGNTDASGTYLIPRPKSSSSATLRRQLQAQNDYLGPYQSYGTEGKSTVTITPVVSTLVGTKKNTIRTSQVHLERVGLKMYMGPYEAVIYTVEWQ